MTFETFTSNLTNLKEYKHSLIEIESDLSLILYEMTGVKGISYDKQPMSYNPSLTEQKRLEMVERYNEKQKEYDFTLLAIEQTEITLKKMPMDLQIMLGEKFINGMTYEEIAKLHGYSANGMWHYIRRETEKWL